MNCIYGNKFITNNITNIIKEQFITENIINIPKNTKLNNYVKYVNLSEPNILQITINNKNISITENDIQKHDIIIEIMSINETDNNNIDINKTIYMTYYKNIPEKIKTRWIKYNTDYRIDFSLDKDCLDFLKKNFNTYIYDLFNNIDEGKYKADLWRLCKLFKHSGVYADVDLVPYLNIDKLDKNIIFYSCLSININAIFQALIINFSKPNHPLFLVLLLSFLINKLYKSLNGPTYDMYNCIKYMLNINTILPEKKYEIDFLKLKICIGSSTNNIKKINLYYFPDNINYTINLHKNFNKDTFNFKIVNNYLIVERIDLLEGWEHNHYIDICFPYKCSFFFFKEENKPMNHWSKSYVTYKNIKILDSRDIDYYKNQGW